MFVQFYYTWPSFLWDQWDPAKAKSLHKHITFQASASVTFDKILLAEASHVMKPTIIDRQLNSSDEGGGSSME